MTRSLFITGTGTDIGKTVLSLTTLLWARSRGLSVAYVKPVQCGSRKPGLQFGDADWVSAAWPDIRAVSSVYTFPDPVSPHLAVEKSGGWIDPAWMIEQTELAGRSADLLVIEGAGGAAVPLNREGLSMADVAAQAGWPCLIGAQPGLGTLHHTLTTAHFLTTRGAQVAGFAFLRSTPDVSPLAADNAATLSSLTGTPFFGTVPYCPGLDRRLPVPPAVAGLLASSLPGLDAWWDHGSGA
jgi:dethiobiotin synthetase